MNIDKICEQLTIDEKIRLLGGVGDWHTYDCNGKIPSIMMTDGPHGIRKLEQEKVGDIETSKPATCFGILLLLKRWVKRLRKKQKKSRYPLC